MHRKERDAILENILVERLRTHAASLSALRARMAARIEALSR